MPEKKILLVDDDEDMLMMTGRWLAKAGYNVVSVSSGKSALGKIMEDKPDLVLLDFSMPEMDGVETLSEIRNTEDINDVPVIFLTGMEADETINSAKEYNPQGFISKSCGKKTILDTLSAFFVD